MILVNYGSKAKRKQDLLASAIALKKIYTFSNSSYHPTPLLGSFPKPSRHTKAVHPPTGEGSPREATPFPCQKRLVPSPQSSLHDYCVAWQHTNTLDQPSDAPKPALCLREWAADLNERGTRSTAASSRLMAAWRCEGCSKSFFERVHFRAFGRGPNTSACPFCLPRNNLTMTHPHLASEYTGRCCDSQGEQYQLDAHQITASDLLTCQWHCRSCGNQWLRAVSQRASGEKESSCATCALIGGSSKESLRPTALLADSTQSDALFHRFPALFRELSKKRHRQLRLGQLKAISVYSHERLHWICRKCDREYLASPYERTFSHRRSSTEPQGLPTCCPKCIWQHHETVDLNTRSQPVEFNGPLSSLVPRKSRWVPASMNPSCFSHGESTRLMDNDLIN